MLRASIFVHPVSTRSTHFHAPVKASEVLLACSAISRMSIVRFRMHPPLLCTPIGMHRVLLLMCSVVLHMHSTILRVPIDARAERCSALHVRSAAPHTLIGVHMEHCSDARRLALLRACKSMQTMPLRVQNSRCANALHPLRKVSATKFLKKFIRNSILNNHKNFWGACLSPLIKKFWVAYF